MFAILKDLKKNFQAYLCSSVTDKVADILIRYTYWFWSQLEGNKNFNQLK